MSRASNYMQAYAATYAQAQRWKQIQESVSDDFKRQVEMEKLINEEAKALADLEETFRVKVAPNKYGPLLESLEAEGIAAEKALAAAAAANRARGAAGPAIAKPMQNLAGGNAGERKNSTNAAVREMARAPQKYTQEEFDNARKAAVDAGATEAVALIDSLKARGATVKPPESPKTANVSSDKSDTLLRAIEAELNASDVGYVGGFTGEATANQRKQTPAVLDKDTDDARPSKVFKTDEDAYRAYLTAIEDGDPSELEELGKDEAIFAARVYKDAKELGAYQRREAKYFEPAWIGQAARLKQAKESAAAAKEKLAGRTPEQEAAFRELRARGIDPEDPYAQYLGTANYDRFKGADAISSSMKGEPLRPVNSVQSKTKALIDQYAAYNIQWRIADLEKQLGKTLKGKDLDNAIAFALAYDKQLEQGTPSKSQLQQQQALKKREEAAKEQQYAESLRDVVEIEKDMREIANQSQTGLEPMRRAEIERRVAGKNTGLIPEDELDALTLKLASSTVKSLTPEGRKMRPGVDMSSFSRGIDAEGNKVVRLPQRVIDDLRAGQASMHGSWPQRAVGLQSQEPIEVITQRDINLPRPALPTSAIPVVASTPPAPVAFAPVEFVEKETPYSYRTREDGAFDVFKNGQQTGVALPGSPQWNAIESVRTTGKPRRVINLDEAPAPPRKQPKPPTPPKPPAPPADKQLTPAEVEDLYNKYK